MSREHSKGHPGNPPEVEAEALVVGSGFGGAVAACRLVQAGFDVVVLERGRRYRAEDFPRVGDFPPLPADFALLPDWRRWTWSGGQGLWDILDLEELISVQAAGWGGGSLIYANVHLRPPDKVFDKRWPEVYWEGNVLGRYFDLAAYMLEVAPVTAHGEFADKLVKTKRLEAAAQKLDRGVFFHPPLAIQYPKAGVPAAGSLPNRHGFQQGACIACGSCCTGCPTKAKNTLDFNYLALAEQGGARSLTECEVTDIVEVDGGFEVIYFNHVAARRELARCRYLFLCAGSVHTTRLLARAKLRNCEGRRFVGAGYFPGGDAVGVAYDTVESLYPDRGPTIAGALVHGDVQQGSFSMIQDGGYARELARAVGMLRAPLWLGRNMLSRSRGPRSLPMTAPRPDPAAFIMVSPLDELLDAISNGDYSKCISPEQRKIFQALLQELSGPLSLPSVVDRTVEDRLRQHWSEGCWTKHLNPGRIPLKWVLDFERWCVRKFVGTSDQIAGTALKELFDPRKLSRHEIARGVLGYSAEGADRRLMLLAMGRDAAAGFLHYDARTDRLVADLDLYRLVPGYSRDQALMTEIAGEVGGELRISPAYEFLGKPITVHNQGGCGMGPPGKSVTDPNGAVRGCNGLYVLDGALLCSPVGVNPSATILALAERNIVQFIRTERPGRAHYPNWPEGDPSPGARQYQKQDAEAAAWIAARRAQGWQFAPPPQKQVQARALLPALGLTFDESMVGNYNPTHSLPPNGPAGDLVYRLEEQQGLPRYKLDLHFNVSIRDLMLFMEDMDHEMSLGGHVNIVLPGQENVIRASATGTVRLPIPRAKPYGLRRQDQRRQAQEHFAGPYTTVRGDARRDSRLMLYRVNFAEKREGSEKVDRFWRIEGKKRIKDDPGVDAWRDTSSLFTKLFGPLPAELDLKMRARPADLAGIGVVHVELNDFLFKQLPSIRATPAGTEPARAAWAVATFASFFFGTLQRIYLPEVKAFASTLFRVKAAHSPYAPFRRGFSG